MDFMFVTLQLKKHPTLNTTVNNKGEMTAPGSPSDFMTLFISVQKPSSVPLFEKNTNSGYNTLYCEAVFLKIVISLQFGILNPASCI